MHFFPSHPHLQHTWLIDERSRASFCSMDRSTHERHASCVHYHAIITEGTDVGTVHKVCANPTCPVHHAKKPTRASANDAQFKAQQEKQRREEAIATSIGIRTLAAISATVPVRLMKRDLMFVTERLATLVDERRLEIVAKQRGIKREKDSDSFRSCARKKPGSHRCAYVANFTRH
jgi:ParB family chromosome partitioning protein